MLTQAVMNQSRQERLLPIRNQKDKSKLLVHEMYASIQGESTYAGLPCAFVRLTGCHLRCRYCDTEHAFFEGQALCISQVMATVEAFGLKLVELTGGEPLLQKGAFELSRRFCDAGYTVLVETSGAVSIDKLDRRVKAIVDIKTPGSGESERNHYENLEQLWPGCEVKFVIGDHADYEFAKEIVARHKLIGRTQVLFSPMAPHLAPELLAYWILQDRIEVRLQLQLHRILWGEKTGV